MPPSESTCAQCGEAGGELLRCSKCRSTFYCGAACQKSHWKAHKKTCSAPAPERTTPAYVPPAFGGQRWQPPQRQPQTGPALWTAATEGKADKVAELLTGGADVEGHGGPVKSTPLFEASYKNHISICEMLLDKGAEVDGTNESGATPLQATAMFGHKEVIKLLLERGADVSSKMSTGGMLDATPIHSAALGGHTEIVAMFLEKGADMEALTAGLGFRV